MDGSYRINGQAKAAVAVERTEPTGELIRDEYLPVVFLNDDQRFSVVSGCNLVLLTGDEAQGIAHGNILVLPRPSVRLRRRSALGVR
jgi:hypothetical protein